jgi:hypothetical protein
MILKSSDNSEIELKIINYEFEKIQKDLHSTNFLRIHVIVKSLHFSWEFKGPYLLTWEILSIAKWLKAIANNDTSTRKKEFIEHNLRFRLVKKSKSLKTIRVYFSQEGRPPDMVSRPAIKKNFWLDFTITDAVLISASDSLLSELNSFPIRNSPIGVE